MTDRRGSVLRRDLNDLVRDDTGHLSPAKIGTLAGQCLSIKLILENGATIIANWDSLMVLFSVLIAPELFKKMLNMKYGATMSDTMTTETSTQTKTSKAAP